MKCKELIRESNNVYMLDEQKYKLDLQDDYAIQKYEKVHKISVKDMINSFLATHDNHFKKFILDIESLVEKYNIDYFIYGDGDVAYDKVSIIYNLKNRKSNIDCILKIFYDTSDNKYSDKVSYMIDFSSGSCGDTYGYSFYNHFRYERFNIIKNQLEKYFSNEDGYENDKSIIANCTESIFNRLKKYYSE